MKPAKHNRDHSARGEDAVPVVIHRKVFRDDEEVAAGDDAARWTVGPEFHGCYLRAAHGTVTTASSSGIVRWQVHNVTNADDLLSTRTSIDANETTSWTAATPHVVDETAEGNLLARGDVLRIDVDDAGTGAMGLEVWLELGPRVMRLT